MAADENIEAWRLFIGKKIPGNGHHFFFAAFDDRDASVCETAAVKTIFFVKSSMIHLQKKVSVLLHHMLRKS